MQIHWRNLDEIRDEEREAAERKLRALGNGQSDLIDLRISARPSSHHRHGGHEVRIACQARGKEIVAARTRPEIGLALNEAVDAFVREVRRLRDRRGDRHAHDAPIPPYLGIVDRVLREEGYGFILTDGGESVYFHRNAVHGGLEFERLEEGARVGLQVEAGDQGLQASAVMPAPPGVPSP